MRFLAIVGVTAVSASMENEWEGLRRRVRSVGRNDRGSYSAVDDKSRPRGLSDGWPRDTDCGKYENSSSDQDDETVEEVNPVAENQDAVSVVAEVHVNHVTGIVDGSEIVEPVTSPVTGIPDERVPVPANQGGIVLTPPVRSVPRSAPET